MNNVPKNSNTVLAGPRLRTALRQTDVITRIPESSGKAGGGRRGQALPFGTQLSADQI